MTVVFFEMLSLKDRINDCNDEAEIMSVVVPFLAERGWTLGELLEELRKTDPDLADACPLVGFRN